MRVVAAVLAFLLTGLGSGVAAAQADWRPLPEGKGVSLDLFAGQDTPPGGTAIGGSSTFTVLRAGARLPLLGPLTAVGSVPVALLDLETGGDGARSTSVGVGNPYLGLAATAVPPGLPETSVEVGVYLPVSTDEPASGERAQVSDATVATAGLGADYEHAETYDGDVLTGRLRIGARLPVSPEITLRGSLAPLLSVSVGERPAEAEEANRPRSNLAVAFGAFVDGQVGTLALSAGAIGRYDPDAGRLAFFNSLVASVLASASVDAGAVRPGVLLRANVEGSGGVSPVLGLSLDVPLR